jgi:hypothetical protein
MPEKFVPAVFALLRHFDPIIRMKRAAITGNNLA